MTSTGLRDFNFIDVGNERLRFLLTTRSRRWQIKKCKKTFKFPFKKFILRSLIWAVMLYDTCYIKVCMFSRQLSPFLSLHWFLFVEFRHVGAFYIANFLSISPTFRAYHQLSGHMTNFPIISPPWIIANFVTIGDLPTLTRPCHMKLSTSTDKLSNSNALQPKTKRQTVMCCNLK